MCSVWATRSITSATRSPQRETPAGGGRRGFGESRVYPREVDDRFVATAFFLVVVDFRVEADLLFDVDFLAEADLLFDAAFLVEADLLLDDFFAATFDFDDFEDLADAFDFAARDARAERDDLARRLRAERERVATGRFQPTARSARNDAGMLRMPSSESVTASAAASARSARTSLITFAGRRAFAACTRLVSSTTNISRSGSIQSEVPVNPVWP